jgi:hypothetical protein
LLKARRDTRANGRASDLTYHAIRMLNKRFESRMQNMTLRLEERLEG